jgi:hypothetical protein
LSVESRAMIAAELQAETTPPRPRQTHVLRLVGVSPSSWHRPPHVGERKRPGPARRPIADGVVEAVVAMAMTNPWYGYKRIAVMCRRAEQTVKDREAYVVMKDHGLLHKRKTRRAEVYQAAKLFELLPQRPNDLWQMDVTYIHIPGHGWWYAVTVIDYYSRYLLACHLTPSSSAIETAYALKVARAEAERIHGPLAKRPFLVTDNGPSFIAEGLRRSLPTSMPCGSRTARRSSWDCWNGSTARYTEEAYGAVRPSPALSRVPGRVPRSLQRPSASLGVGSRRRGRSVGSGGSLRRRPNDPDSALATVGSRGASQVGEAFGGRGVKRTSCRDFARFVRATRALIAAPGPRLASSPVREAETKIVTEVSHKISPSDST